LADEANARIALRMSNFTDASSLRVGTFRISICLLFSSIGGLTVTIIDLCTTFSTDERARELLERLRWPNGPQCVRCAGEVVRLANSSKLLYCKACDYQFTVTADTVFHDSHLPLIKWLTATYLLCEARKGMSANQVKRNIGVSYKTAWYLCHRIRAAMKETQPAPLDGIVECDETYVGGKLRGKGVWAGKQNKEVVFGIKQRNGELRFFHAEDAKSGTLAKYIKENISEDVEVIITDELGVYPFALAKAGHGNSTHKTIKHKDHVYVDGDITTNGIESAFSLLKRGIVGSWHKVSAKHLSAYLDEMTFRFNRRNSHTLFLETLQHMVTANPLSYERLTA
jgi:transposase-like protein